jgi:hypothetical protein
MANMWSMQSNAPVAIDVLPLRSRRRAISEKLPLTVNQLTTTSDSDSSHNNA